MTNKASHILKAQVEKVSRAQYEDLDMEAYSAEASELGWPVGHWPAVVETDLGNKARLTRYSLNADCAVYRQDFGNLEVTVFND